MQGTSTCCRFWGSTIGMKVLMALTGVVLFGFVVGHVSGNLLVFAGRDAINAYSKWLHDHPGLLWTARIVLLASVAAHIYASIRLTLLKGEARPVPYEAKEAHGSTFASRTMMWSGPIIALFVIYHILHLTTGHMHPAGFNAGDVYGNLIKSFKMPLISLVYVAAMLGLAFHLSHGVWSMLQTVGVNRPNWDRCLRCCSALFAALVTAGFIAVPVAILAGIVS